MSFITLTHKCTNKECDRFNQPHTNLWRRDEQPNCPSCGNEMERLLSAPNIAGMDKYGRSK